MIKGYFGLPGSGKTTFLTMIAQRELKRIKRGKSAYKRVLTNFYCQGCYMINYADLGLYDLSYSLILLDEITLDADSRNFKQFDQIKKKAFLLHRHYHIDIIYFTQQWDGVDKKIRDITHDLYYVKKCRLPLLDNISVATRIYRMLDINEQTHEIINGYRFPNWFDRFFFRTKEWCIRPLYYKYFDSFEVEELDPFNFVEWDTPPACGECHTEQENYPEN